MNQGKDSLGYQTEALQFLINSLGDKHGTIRSAKDHSLVVYYTGKSTTVDNREPQFLQTVINDINAKFSYELLDDGVGYLRIVGIGPGNVKEQADFIRKGLLDLKSNHVDKWIVDLRFNGGGNIEPMLSGLAPLVGSGLVAGSINRNNEKRKYEIDNGQFINHGRLACEMENTPTFSEKEKVVVLLSRYTISSGELTAIAFKGRPNTRFIGEETAGYTTGNGYDKINNDLILVISQDVFMDRNQKKYDKKVDVDEYIEFQHHVEMENDLQIKRSINWLNTDS